MPAAKHSTGAERLPPLADHIRAIIRPRERLSIADWSERYRWITQGPLVGSAGEPVRWSNQTFPLQAGIMEAIESARWSRVAVIGPPQSGGKTDCAAINPICWAIQHRLQDALYMSANSFKAYDQWEKKFKPAIQASPELSRLIPEDREEGGTKVRRDFSNGCSLFIAGAESVANISGSTIPVIICDDVQAMPKNVGAFGHACDVAFKRSAALEESERIHVMLGTAGTVEDYLWTTVSRGTHFRPYMPCPECGTYQILEWDRMQFDETDPVAANDDTWMRCANDECTRQIRDEDLAVMLRGVRWAARGQTVNTDGTIEGDMPATRVASFWWNALYWPFTSWGPMAADWIESRGDPEREKDFQQHVQVVPWKEPEIDEERITEEEIATHTSVGYPAGCVPAAADLVITTVDVQAGYVYYIHRAWRKADGETWLIDLGTYGRPDKTGSMQERAGRRAIGISSSLDDVDREIAKGFDVIQPDGEITGKAHVVRGLIDIGYEPDIVGRWWTARHRGVWHLIKGLKAGSKGGLWPIQPKRDKYRRPYRSVDVNQAKHLLRRLMRIAKGESGYWHMPETGVHANTSRAYARHMSSERFDRSRKIPAWIKQDGMRANHFWDCETYQIVAAVSLGVQLRSVEAATERKAPVKWFASRKAARRR